MNLFTIFGNNAKRLTDTNAIGLQYVCKGLTGVLRTLIGIEDIRLAIAIQGLFKRIYTKLLPILIDSRQDRILRLYPSMMTAR